MNNPYGINEIRILPMSKIKEFKTEEEAREYLSVELIQENGKYDYRKSGLIVENPYALILFQYDNAIIGYGILKDTEKDLSENNESNTYQGKYQFFTMTIHNIDKITLEKLKEKAPDVTHFSNAKWRIDMKYYEDIYGLLLKKQMDFYKRFYKPKK